MNIEGDPTKKCVTDANCIVSRFVLLALVAICRKCFWLVAWLDSVKTLLGLSPIRNALNSRIESPFKFKDVVQQVSRTFEARSGAAIMHSRASSSYYF